MTDEKIEAAKAVHISGLKQRIEILLASNADDFFARPAWGEINFSEIVAVWNERLRRILEALLKSELKFLEVDDFSAINKFLAPIEQLKIEISDFRPSAVATPLQRRNELQSQMRGKIEDFVVYIHRFSLFLTLEQLSSDERHLIEKKFAEEADLLISSLEKSEADAQKKANEVQTILEGARAATAKIGVEKHSQIFFSESNVLHTTSNRWMIATIFVTVFSISVAIYFYLNPVAVHDDVALSIQIVVAKIIIMSILLGAIVWCGKNYRALAHEASVNKHRANALSTFRTFVDATDEIDIRNAVLLEATRAIFSQAPSGYLDKGDASGADTRVLEVVRSLSASLPKGHQ